MAAAAPFILAAVSTGTQITQQRKAKKATRRARRVERRAADIQNVRARKKQLAERRRLEASTLAQAGNSGIAGSSAVSGVVGSIGSQFAANAGFSNQLERIEAERNRFTDRAGRAVQRGATLGALFSGASNIATQLESNND